jgi:hypothetical protein
MGYTAAVAACAAALLAPATFAQDLGDASTGREMLFSSPGAELPDVYLSESVIFLNEAASETYSIVLTHPPGMREDETIDLDNDEVRIYLTSSQEVFQQDDSGTGGSASVDFEQRRNHRTQLIISTNDINDDGGYDTTTAATAKSAFAHVETTLWANDPYGVGLSDGDPANGADDSNIALPLGPLPYVYKTYSTVGGNIPEQQSPISADGTTLLSVCPVCTHPAYCTLYDGTTHDLVNNLDSPDAADGTSRTRIIPGSNIPITGEPEFQGCYQVKITYAPVMDMCATDPNRVVSDLNPLVGPCAKTQDGFTIYDGLLPRQAGGSHPEAPGWSYESPVPMVHTIPGNSDYRIDEIGDQVLRTRADPRTLCRYSNCPELTLNGGDQQPESPNYLYTTWSSQGPAVHGATQGGGSWRGDLSSSAQLVFDSTNWNTPQTVQVTARQDNVYEPEVNNRGQDAYVHHFVVSQDINLEHTYYDDIEVNDLTVSVTDDDPAVVIESHNEVEPTEGAPNSAVSLRLASEPMYPVTVYLQSGAFFADTDGPPTAADFQPDDEQVIFQDRGQYETCWSMDSTVRTYTYDIVRDQPKSYRANAQDIDHGGTFNYQGCYEDGNGVFTLVDAPIDERPPSPSTRQIEATMQCHGDDRCTYKNAGGSTATVPLPNGFYPRDNFFESRDALVHTSGVGSSPKTGSTCHIVDCANVENIFDSIGHYVETGQEAGTRDATTATDSSSATDHLTSPVQETGVVDGVATGTNPGPNVGTNVASQRSCKNDGNFLTLRTYSADGHSHLPTTGYTCNSYVTFSTTNWDTWQTLDVIGVNDDYDEGAFRISEIGYLYESLDWYYNSAGSKLITSANTAYQPTENGITGVVTGRDGSAECKSAAGTTVQCDGSTCADKDACEAAGGAYGKPVADVHLSMFDTRFGKHINRYPRVSAGSPDDDTDAYGTTDQKATLDGVYADDPTVVAGATTDWSSADTSIDADNKVWEQTSFDGIPVANQQLTFQQANGDGGGYYGTPSQWGTPCHGNSQCRRTAPFHEGGIDADNEVCCCEDPAADVNTDQVIVDDRGVANTVTNNAGDAVTVLSYGESFGANGARTAEDPLQVQTFDPSEYANRNVQCGAQVVVTDNDKNGVTISRSECEATEGRRFWFDTFQQEPTPMECAKSGGLYSLAADGGMGPPMEVTLGLFTATRASTNEYQQPAYTRDYTLGGSVTDARLAALPSYGSIEGGYRGYCKLDRVCTHKDECDVDGGGHYSENGLNRWQCESGTNFNGVFWPADLQVGATCYDTTIDEAACTTEGGEWFEEDNTLEVDDGRVVADGAGGFTGAGVGGGQGDTVDYRQAGSCSDSSSVTASECLGAGGTWDSSSAAAQTDGAAYNTIMCPSAGADGWSMTDIPDTDYRGMTAPVCPYTIVLDTSPAEGATVVVHLREDETTSSLRDHELYFYEEASYRPGVIEADCTPILYPGSSWIDVGASAGCFIHNVPMAAPTQDGLIQVPVPRGSTDLDVMFTDDDWNVPRRITTIALNDDVDEPTEIRTIYHTTSGCEGYNHNNDDTCIEDPTYTDIAVASVDVVVVDDDIADLVVIGDDGYVCTTDPGVDGNGNPQRCVASEANIIDESFIGSYDAAGPRLELTINYWYQRFERQGPYAEDGISGSNFQGRSQDHTDSRNECCNAAFPKIDLGNDGSVSVQGRDPQIKDDGIGAGGFQLWSRAVGGTRAGIVGTGIAGADHPGTAVVHDNDIESATQGSNQVLGGTFNGGNFAEKSITGGYITDNEDPLCLNPDPMLQDDRCFRIDDVAWTHYDPYWDTYVADDTAYTAYDAAQPRHVYDGCTPTGSNDGDADRGSDWMTTCAGGGGALGPASTQPNRGFKGVGPAYTEPEDEFAVTIHSRECRGDVLGDGSTDPESTTNGPGTQIGGADAYRQDQSGAEPAGIDEDDEACLYGTFQVRLNSSPGTKHVTRRYVGEPDSVLEEELVQIVITPDVTPQTMFDPVSVTFTHTGGTVNGVDTNRWDEPFRFKVVPVDDEVDERAGVTIDYTSFTITQSHLGDEYWTYTTPYQTKDTVGSMKVAGDANTGREDEHTPFRHHIRTIHTRDNDYAGVTVEKPDVQSMTQTADTGNYLTTDPVSVDVVEGETFGFYTLRLKSQPRKVQRQAGTNPNAPVITGTPGAARADFDHTVPGGRVDVTDSTLYTTPGATEAEDGTDMAGIYHGQHVGMATAADNCDHEDFSDVTRPSQCGSVEAEQDYWVDVTVTQTIHLDLAEPGSCPTDAPWGGGRTPPTTEHPRFPYNANSGKPINELVETADDLDSYLSTCGGWQRDATYRFTADDWNVPQYVYLYAHNDKDAASGSSARHVDVGGNEESSPTTTVLKHYVETQDTLDNAEGAYVQRNKHGAQYTSGNSERYPFGVISGSGWTGDTGNADADGTAHVADTGTTTTNQPIQGADNTQQPILTEPFGNRETGFSTYGYSDYKWQYGYYLQEHTWTGVHYAQTPCGAVHMGAGIGHATDATNSADSLTNVGIHYSWGYATSDTHDTTLGPAGTDTKLPIASRKTDGDEAGGPGWADGYAQPNADPSGTGLDFAGEICEDPFDNLKPYTQIGTHCVPIRSDTVAAHSGVGPTPAAPNSGGGEQVDAAYARDEAVTASPGPNRANIGPLTVANAAVLNSGITMGVAATTKNHAELTWTTLNNPDSGGLATEQDPMEQHYCVPKYATKNGGMKFKPIDVTVTVTDNDDIATQGAITCSPSDEAAGTCTQCRQTSLFSSTGKTEWLVDHNCEGGDAGGLPGYPVSQSGSLIGDALVSGDDQCASGTGPYCTTAGTATTGGSCDESGAASTTCAEGLACVAGVCGSQANTISGR